jgi:hypothetical protein
MLQRVSRSAYSRPAFTSCRSRWTVSRLLSSSMLLPGLELIVMCRRHAFLTADRYSPYHSDGPPALAQRVVVVSSSGSPPDLWDVVPEAGCHAF